MIDAARNEGRVVYFDYLRVLATCAVVVNHVDVPLAEQKMNQGFAADVLFRVVSATTDALGMWAVPVFIMISGALFLRREIPVKRIYAKNVLRLYVAWLVWSAIYASFLDGSVFYKIRSALNNSGQPHLWFLPLMIGLYICVPIFKQIIASESVAKYFLKLAFVLNFLVFTISINIDYFGNDLLYKLKDISGIDNFVALMNAHLVLGFSAFFMLGYFLDQKETSTRTRTVLYSLGFVAFVLTILYYWFSPYRNLARRPNFFFPEGYFVVNFLLMGAAVFILFKRLPLKRSRFIEFLSKYSFGAYLAHYLPIKLFAEFLHLDATSFNPLVSFPLIAISAIVISYTISAVLHKIPVVNRYLV